MSETDEQQAMRRDAVRQYAALVWRVHRRLKSEKPAGKLDESVLYSYDPDRKVEQLPNN